MMTDGYGGLRGSAALLVDHVRRGTVLDLADGEPVDPDVMRSWSASHDIDADVIRDILRGRLVTDPDPHGVRLRGARLIGRLDLEDLSTGVNLDLRECFLPEGLAAGDASLHALRLEGCLLEHASGSAIAADRLVASLLVLRASTVIGHGSAGAVALQGARLDGLDCDRARIRNDSGPALRAGSLRVEQDVFLRWGFEAVGAGDDGAVCLLGARTARFECDGARLRNDCGPALRADSLQVDQRAFLRAGFEAVGTGELGTVRLNGARLGLFAARRVALRNDSGPALVAEAMQVERGVLCDDDFEAVGAAADGVLQLAGTRIGGRLLLDMSRVRNADACKPLIALDGLTYAGIPEGTSVDSWLTLLARGTPRYAAQPYQHLAAAYRAAGHDREARKILIAQRKDEIRRGELGPGGQAWARFTGLTLGYGYRPWLALAWLATVVAAAVILALHAGATGGLAHTSRSSTPTQPCTTVEQVGVGLDLSLPLIRTGARDTCTTTNTPAGQRLTLAGWMLQLLAWALATLFVAGFTSAVRKT
jgi:hypothetical protein